MFKVGDLVTCKSKSFYTYTTKGVICEVIELYENYGDMLVKIRDANGVVSEELENGEWTVEIENFELIVSKKNNISEWR